VTLVGTCDPTGKCDFSVTPTPTPTMTKTPVYTVTPTKTTTPTPTTTPTKTVTPTVTKTPTQTPSVTPTITPTKTTTPTVTSTVTSTVTPSPSRTSLIGPFFRFTNEINQTTDLIFRTETGQTFDIRWGDGTSINAVPSNAVFGDVTYSKLYGGTIFTGSADNFRVSSISSVNKIQQLSLRNISNIEANQYTFSAFSAVTFIKVLDSSISSFNHSLPNGLINLEFNNVLGGGNLFSQNPFTFNPVFTNRAPFRDLFITNTNINTFNYPITGGTGTPDQRIRFTSNVVLTSITMSVSSVLRELNISNSQRLTDLNFPTQLTAATNLVTLGVNNNIMLTGWTHSIPPLVDYAGLYQNKFSSFDIDLNLNTNLVRLYLFNQWELKLSSITNTISACTSLRQLRLDNNSLTSLPPIFPNSIEILRFENNKVTGYTSNIPNSLEYFDGSSASGNQNVFTTWNTTLTNATNLNYFNLTNVGLTEWTTQFPLSIREVYLGQNRIFPIFNIALVSGATILDLGFNTGLTTVRNLSFNNTIQTLKLNSTAIISDIDLNTPFPSSLRNLYLNKTLLTNFSISFSNCPSINYITFNQTPLNQTSVDFILYDLRYNNSANYGQLILNGPGGPATPSAAGLVNRSYLINTRGWQVPIN
jgi:hypothetical protein